jgi:serine/threonine-protein kinase
MDTLNTQKDSMPSRVGRSLSLRSTSGSFEETQRDLLIKRARMVFGVVLASTVIFLAVIEFIQIPDLAASELFGPWKSILDWTYVAAPVLGLAFLYFGKPGVRAIQVSVFSVTAYIITLALLTTPLFKPDMEPSAFIALLLFLTAAFCPWRVTFQAGLAAIAFVASVGGYVLTYRNVPAVTAYWETAGGYDAFRGHVIVAGLSVAILGAVSVLVTRSLYDLRRTVHKAKRLGNYIVHREIGRGGMGRVFVAEHALMCRPTALKVLEPGGTAASEALARFEREVRLSASLSHPNTITIFDFGRSSDNTFYYAMEFLEGMDLQVLVERFGPIPENRVIYLLKQMLGSLTEAHERDIIHRDLKPSNIFLTTRGGLFDFVKVMDFGLAKQLTPDAADTAPGLTKAGVVYGTPRFISPETVYGTSTADHRADLYNVGAVAYWMLTGQPPFTATSSVELLVDHVKTVPKPPSAVSELPISPEMDAFVMTCLEKDPADRFQSAREMTQALEEIPDDLPWTEAQAESWWELHMKEHKFVEECFCGPMDAAEAEVAADLGIFGIAGSV